MHRLIMMLVAPRFGTAIYNQLELTCRSRSSLCAQWFQVAGGGERAPREPKAAKAPAQPRAPREPNADGTPAAPARRRNRRKGAAAAGADGAAPAAAAASSEPRAPKASKRQSTIPDANHTLLYVNNLSFDSTTEDVSKLFSDRLGAAPKEVDCVLIRRLHRGQLHRLPYRYLLAECSP